MDVASFTALLNLKSNVEDYKGGGAKRKERAEMSGLYVLGTFMTAFGRAEARSHKDLAKQAVLGALADAGLADGAMIEGIAVGCCAASLWGQHAVAGQTLLAPLVKEGLLARYCPVTNVEGGCATGSLAFQSAAKDILSGRCHFSLALGVEKTSDKAVKEGLGALLEGGLDQFDKETWQKLYREEARRFDLDYDPKPGLTLLETYSLKTQYHKKQRGLTDQHLALVTEKNRANGALNEKAFLREPVSEEEILNESPLVPSLSRSMCAALGDGAAAVVLCSEEALEELSLKQQGRAVKVAASVLVGGYPRALDENSALQFAAGQAYWEAELLPAEIDFAEVHDATSYSEIVAYEDLSFCESGDGGNYLVSGATALNGERPVNASGGLLSKGHPLAATGLAMIHEVSLQIRGEAGSRQLPKANCGLIQNGGGLMGFDEAAVAVTILQKRH
jgi:acetyl-CoA acetyltransferase